MKLIRLCYILVILIFLTPFQLFALTASGTATGIIAVPVSIVENTPLFFGKFASNSGGTITLTAALPAGKTVSGVSALTNPTATAGKFTVSGEAGAIYTIMLPTSTSLTGPGTAMTVDTFVSSPSSTGTLTGGTQILYVGAKLTANSGQAVGTYNGTYVITVAYQ